ncbi:MAG: FeoB-associated Cys-rich membrane protein [Clostridiales bacterium]|nr:FeoB-associated Cys-rich membrane protein [Clostridiales bacterium]
MNLLSIIILGLVVVWVVCAVRYMVKRNKNGCGCCSSCSSCTKKCCKKK